MLGIIGAMDVEISAVKSKITEKTVAKIAGIDFVCGKIDDVMVCAAQCSPGKVNAALCTQIMIDHFNVTSVINVGVGCSLNEKVSIKNIVIASDVCQYDYDTTAIDDVPCGFVSGINTIKIPTDKAMSDALARTAINCGEIIHRGTVATGDTFIAGSELKNRLSQEFDALCGEMEGGAVGHVCYVNHVPFAVLRSISDGGNDDVQIDYPAFKKIAASISSSIIIAYIKKQKTQLTFE